MSKQKKKRRALIGLITALTFLFAKFKYLFIILKLTKLSSLLTLFLSLGVYALTFGWTFAIALMYSLVTHESGHMLAAKRRGVSTSPIFFIPFLGAAVGLKGKIRHAKDESYVAYGGPFLSTIATIIALALYRVIHADVFLLSVYLGSVINLFNLIPISPLDGGRIITAISPKIWVAGLILLSVYLFFSPNPIILFILILGIAQVITRIREPHDGRLIEAYLRLLKRRKEEFVQFQKIEDIYERNLMIYEEEQRAEHLRERIARLKENPNVRKSFRKYRLYFFQKQEEIDNETTLRDPDHGLVWLVKTIKEEEKKASRFKNYFCTSVKEKLLVTAAYLALVFVLGILYYISRDLLPDPDAL
ncbi:site-2 protease family protein [Sporolactobacillus sp. THM7-4]|nr:site-2 protease family protein [Sporolactobacillus sp. THM7-4]